MKIIAVDNFSRDDVADRLIVGQVDKAWGERIIKLLNDKYSGDHADSYYKLVEDDHKLNEGFKP